MHAEPASPAYLYPKLKNTPTQHIPSILPKALAGTSTSRLLRLYSIVRRIALLPPTATFALHPSIFLE